MVRKLALRIAATGEVHHQRYSSFKSETDLLRATPR